MRRDLIFLAGLAALLAGGAWWWRDGQPAETPGRIVVATVPASAAPSAAPAAAVGTAPVALASITLLETETPDETGAGAATLRYPDGDVRRIAVGDALDRATVLTGVTDTSATFRAAGRSVALQVAHDTARASAETGIDFDAHPTAANPAMARR